MMPSRYLFPARGRSARAGRRRAARSRPASGRGWQACASGGEQLEGRALLAVTPIQFGSTLSIQVDSADADTTAYVRLSGGSIDVSADPTFATFDAFPAIGVATIQVTGDADSGSEGLELTDGVLAVNLISTNVERLTFTNASSVSGIITATNSTAALFASGIRTAGNAVLSSSVSDVTLGGQIEVNRLDVMAFGDIDQAVGSVIHAATVVATIAASSTSGSVTLDESANQIAAFEAMSSVPSGVVSVATDGPLVVGVSTGGGISVSSNGSIVIAATGTISQIVGGSISGGTLEVSVSTGDILLDEASNNVVAFAATSSGTAADIRLATSGDLVVGVGVTGISSNFATIQIVATGSVTQSAGTAISGDSLSVSGDGPQITLGSTANAVAAFEASNAFPAGKVVLVNGQSLEIGPQGIVTDGGEITVTADGPITVLGPLVYGAGGLTIADVGSTPGSVTFVVMNEADALAPSIPEQSLRDRLRNVSDNNAAAQSQVVTFDLTVESIALSGPLDPIAARVTIDGEGRAVEIDGTTAGLGIDGLRFVDGSQGSRLASLAIGGFGGGGVRIETGSITVAACFIGMAADGSPRANGTGVLVTGLGAQAAVIGESALGNMISSNVVDGVRFEDGAGGTLSSNTIGLGLAGEVAGNGGAGVVLESAGLVTVGGLADDHRNVIAGNAMAGVLVESTATAEIQGNWIGLSADGLSALPNGGAGIRVSGANAAAMIGLDAVGYANVVSGNLGHGIEIDTDGPAVTEILGNIIGLDATGLAAVANGRAGVAVLSASSTVIGQVGFGNTISGNTDEGILIESATNGTLIVGNVVGLDFDGLTVIGNGKDGILVNGGVAASILTNVVSGNLDDGIHVEGVTASGVVVAGNTVGLTSAGDDAAGNAAVGVRIVEVPSAVVGGGSSTARNIVSANGSHGILIASEAVEGGSAAQVAFNYVGTDVAGTTAFANGGDGIRIDGVGADSPNVISNVVSGNQGTGIRVTGGASFARIASNTVGLDASVVAPLGNMGHGIAVEGGESHFVGGSADDANIVAANQESGIVALATINATIVANVTGTETTGAAGLGNVGDGILILDAVATEVRGNLVSANGSSGVSVSGTEGAGSSGTRIVGNLIGTGPTGITGLGNQQHGVAVGFATATTVGGLLGGERNVISGNAGSGVFVDRSDLTDIVANYIGVTANGYSALGNGEVGVYVTGATSTAISGGNIIAFNGSDAAGHGIAIIGAVDTLVGDTRRGLAGGNAIYRNRGDGVRIEDGSTGTQVVGNAIGSTAAGLVGFGNYGHGVGIVRSNESTIGGNRVAEPGRPVLGNLVVGNGGSGISIEQAEPEEGEKGNVVEGNTIRRNRGAGIAVLDSTFQTIGSADADSGNEIGHNSGDGILIDNSEGGAGGHQLVGNAIGTDASGSQKSGNLGDGVSIRTSIGNEVSGNLVSNNRTGIVLLAASAESRNQGNVLAGNTVSANVGDGIRLEGSDGNTVGMTSGPAGNVVVSNGGVGVSLTGGSDGNLVVGNLVGTDSANLVRSNARQGLLISASQENEILGNTIAWNRLGGVRIAGGGGNVIGGDAGSGNIIRTNGGTGVVLAAATTGNAVLGNLVRGNSAGGILVSAANDTRISDGNVVVKNQKYGISLLGATGTEIDGNYVGSNTQSAPALGNRGPGIAIAGGVGTRIGGGSGNAVRNNAGDGIQLTNVTAADASTATLVANNVVAANAGAGIVVAGGSLVTVVDNLVGGETPGAGNGRSGVIVSSGAAGTTVAGNEVAGNAVHGVELVGAVDTVIGGDEAPNTVVGNRGDGVRLSGGTRGTIVAVNEISSNLGDGVQINASLGNAIDGATITGNRRAGVAVVSSKAESTATGNVVTATRVEGNGVGISIQGSAGTSIVSDNSITANAGAGIRVATQSTQTVIAGNDIQENGGSGVEINASRSTLVRDNVIASGRGAGVVLIQASGSTTADGNIVEGNTISGHAGSGIVLAGSSFNTVGGAAANVVFGNLGHGVVLRQASNTNVVTGNIIGVDASMLVDANGGDGIRISGSLSNVIGRPGTGNEIRGNVGTGVAIVDSFAATSATGNVVAGNTLAANGGDGVSLNGGAHVIGGAAGAANTISDNGRHGVSITAPSGVTKIAGASVAGNLIDANGGSGVSLQGTVGAVVSGNQITNHPAAGVAVVGGAGNRVVSNVIGGQLGANAAGVSLADGAAQNLVAGNTISSNEGDGISIAGARTVDNVVGRRVTGIGDAGVANTVFANYGAGIRVAQGVRNQVAGNSIYGNGEGGIVLAAAGNSMQPAPTLTAARRVLVAGRSQVQVTGEVRGAAKQRIVIDFYRNDPGDGDEQTGTGYQARTPIGRTTITLDASGRGIFTATLAANVPVGDRITAVATTASGVVGNSSQQSAVAVPV